MEASLANPPGTSTSTVDGLAVSTAAPTGREDLIAAYVMTREAEIEAAEMVEQLLLEHGLSCPDLNATLAEATEARMALAASLHLDWSPKNGVVHWP